MESTVWNSNFTYFQSMIKFPRALEILSSGCLDVKRTEVTK